SACWRPGPTPRSRCVGGDCGECPGCKEREGKRRDRARRRALKKGAHKTEPVLRRKVFDRDGWRCHLCGQPTNKSAVVPHPKAPTLDHVIPLSAGGDHTYA